jgi:hypothetical protein
VAALNLFNWTDVGISFGGGASVSAGGALLLVEVRYSQGFRNILEDVPGFGLKHTGIQLVAGVTLPVGHRGRPDLRRGPITP